MREYGTDTNVDVDPGGTSPKLHVDRAVNSGVRNMRMYMNIDVDIGLVPGGGAPYCICMVIETLRVALRPRTELGSLRVCRSKANKKVLMAIARTSPLPHIFEEKNARTTLTDEFVVYAKIRGTSKQVEPKK